MKGKLLKILLNVQKYHNLLMIDCIFCYINEYFGWFWDIRKPSIFQPCFNYNKSVNGMGCVGVGINALDLYNAKKLVNNWDPFMLCPIISRHVTFPLSVAKSLP